MELEVINQYILKILIAARPRDSIRAIAMRIKVSYGWTHKWMQSLIRIGAFSAVKNRVILQEKHPFYQDTMGYVKRVFGQDVSFYYNVLEFFGIAYAFTKTDAVFVWTKGGYNISRSRDFYPVFIKIASADKELFDFYCKKIGAQVNSDQGVFFRPEYVSKVKFELCDGVPVDSLQETIKFMRQNIYNFQPALEMTREMYHEGPKIKYQEAARA